MSAVQTEIRDEASLHALAEQVLAQARQVGDAAQVTLRGETAHLTRFAGNRIHQNVSECDLSVSVRVALGQKLGEASTNDLSPAGLRDAVARAAAIARLHAPDPDFPGFAPRYGIDPIPLAHSPRTRGFEPVDRARVVAHVCRDAALEGLTAAGAFQTGVRQLAIATSEGAWAHHLGTTAHFNTVVMGEDSSGWAADTHLDAGLIDGEALAEEAIDRAMRSRHPVDLEPGEYPVILEEYAVLELLSYLGRAFGAEDVAEGRSFLSGRSGEPLIPSALTIIDDPRDVNGLPVPFDDEGVPSRRVPLFEHGVAGHPVHDRRSALAAGCSSTGHHVAGGAFWKSGPRAAHVQMLPGHASKDEMLQATDRGILVTRFHYVNQLDPRRTLLTGMTRDGTFLVEGGKVVRPLRNLRFTQAWLEALQGVDMVGRTTKLGLNWAGGACRAPALRVGRFRFTGKTTF
ncbi:MAG: TldD/PmbA family protein [Candidatus Sericytochromatia bacterium]|nr:TldD/PmbA family protein [Candidatus Sericytochromatia bacterium]